MARERDGVVEGRGRRDIYGVDSSKVDVGMGGAKRVTRASDGTHRGEPQPTRGMSGNGSRDDEKRGSESAVMSDQGLKGAMKLLSQQAKCRG